MSSTLGTERATVPTGGDSPAAVVVDGLRKTYGDIVAIDDVSFAVAEGEIFGILGPNGAGKTTTVECVIGLRTPDSGTIRVMGLDPRKDLDALHAIVGVQLQASALPGQLKVGEILDLFHTFYRDPADLDEIVEALRLDDKLTSYYRALSGGLKQRVSIALALIGRPKVAVLDEMTTGLDPQARRDTWELIEAVRDRGVTILLVGRGRAPVRPGGTLRPRQTCRHRHPRGFGRTGRCGEAGALRALWPLRRCSPHRAARGIARRA